MKGTVAIAEDDDDDDLEDDEEDMLEHTTWLRNQTHHPILGGEPIKSSMLEFRYSYEGFTKQVQKVGGKPF